MPFKASHGETDNIGQEPRALGCMNANTDALGMMKGAMVHILRDIGLAGTVALA